MTRTITNPSYTGYLATATLTITSATAPVTVPTTSQPYTGSPIADPGTTTPAGLTLIYSYRWHGQHDLRAERHASDQSRHLHGDGDGQQCQLHRKRHGRAGRLSRHPATVNLVEFNPDLYRLRRSR